MTECIEYFSKKKVLITGGMGFIGGNLAVTLLDAGAHVTILDADCGTNRLSALSQCASRSSADFVEVDLAVAGKAERLIASGFDHIFHCAGVATVEEGLESPSYTISTNINCALTVLEGIRNSREASAPVIILSSDKVYGEVEEPGGASETTPLRPGGTYDGSKAAVEIIAQSYQARYGLPITILRLCNIYGPFDAHVTSRLVPKTFCRIYNRLIPELYISAHAHSREYLFIRDLVGAILLIARDERAWGEIYNVSGNCCLSTRHMMRLIIESALEIESDGHHSLSIVELQKYLEELPESPNPVGNYRAIRRTRLDNGKIVAKVGFAPQTTIRDGLRATAIHYRSMFCNPLGMFAHIVD